MAATTTPSQCNHQNVLLDRTNVLLQAHSNDLRETNLSKRRPLSPGRDDIPVKRPRPMRPNGETNDADIESCIINMRRHTMHSLLQTSSCRPPSSSLRLTIPSRLLLQSFVCSHKLDEFRCAPFPDESDDNNPNQPSASMTPPYACAYSYSAKSFGAPLLAVATEEGSVSLLNTSKRYEWEYQPQRTIFRPHHNGIFDIKWSLDDTMLATASGDKTTKICSVGTHKILHMLAAHTQTVKCIAWDPCHRDILSTGGRDGRICVWDLRIANRRQGSRDGIPAVQPVITIPDAHGQRKSSGGRKKAPPLPRSITSILYTNAQPQSLVSSTSFDGILNLWDFRQPVLDNHRGPVIPCASSPDDATTTNGSSRSRGITSLCVGSGPTSGLLFALGVDSRLYTYSSPSLIALEAKTYPNLRTSFYVRLASSPCGRWLASGCSEANGSAFLFDVSNAARFSASSLFGQSLGAAVELRGQKGEIGDVDWARDMVATCADDGTVRVWRPDYATYQKCLSDPDADRWNWSWSQDVDKYSSSYEG